MDKLEWLQEWYKKNCNGDWEELYGIEIETLANPGWSVIIDLRGTRFESNTMEDYAYDHGSDWLNYRIEDNKFYGNGDATKLVKLIDVFKKWIDSF